MDYLPNLKAVAERGSANLHGKIREAGPHPLPFWTDNTALREGFHGRDWSAQEVS